jgi:hypothetical protein
MQSMEYFYVLGDGNHIRENVEFYLLNHDLESLSKFSQSLTTAINELKELAISSMNAQVILAGGDDILLSVPRENYRKELIQKLQQAFLTTTGITISFGVGNTVEAAYINLRRAKTRKDDKIVEERDKK